MKQMKFIPQEEETTVRFDPPISAVSTIPPWYKEIDQYINKEPRLRIIPGSQSVNATIKLCVPFLDSLTQGYTLVLSDDVMVEKFFDETVFRWRTSTDLVSDHNPAQHVGLKGPYGYLDRVYKFINEYVIQTPPGYSVYFSHPNNRYDLPFLTLSGVVDTDTYTSPTNFPFFIREDFEGIIPKGTPIVQFFPFKRERWSSSVAKYSKERTMKAHRALMTKIERSYKTVFWSKKYFN
jgi:hypothetical protein